MEYGLVAVAALVVVVATAAFSRKLGVAAPLLLVLLGIGYSFIPGVPEIDLEPDVILHGLLPPILYAAALQLPVVDFRRNFGSITGLSVVLVVLSAVITGLLLFAVLPGIDLATAIALGAVVSPTDVVAATSIGKRLGLPPRLLAILQGEGLVNDATALVLLRSAIAASSLAASEEFDIAAVLGDFGYGVVVAVAIGLLVGVVAVRVRRRLGEPVLDTAISFVVPFVAFLPAEQLHSSGVIAVVVAGIYSGHQSARLTPQARVTERVNWRTVQFVLENTVFLLMGAQLAGIVAEVEADRLPVHAAVLLGVGAAAVLMAVRFAFVWPLLLIVRSSGRRTLQRADRIEELVDRVRDSPRGQAANRRRHDRLDLAVERRRNDAEHIRAEGLGWRGGVVLGWAGMRGVVTLAAAQSLPRDAPYYEQLVLIAFTVAVVTLLLQGATLPLLIRALKIEGPDESAARESIAGLLDDLQSVGFDALQRRVDQGGFDEEVVERVRHDMSLAVDAAREAVRTADEDDELGDHGDPPHAQYRDLRSTVLKAEREALLDARTRGAYPSRVLHRVQGLLDLEEARLREIDVEDAPDERD